MNSGGFELSGQVWVTEQEGSLCCHIYGVTRDWKNSSHYCGADCVSVEENTGPQGQAKVAV